jgi:tetratricopeptide (TPR) repeat protein
MKSYPQETNPTLYMLTASAMFRNGVKKYVQSEYSGALDLFVQSSRMNPDFTLSLVGQAFALYKMECFHEATCLFPKIPSTIAISTLAKLPLEWTSFETRQFWHLRCCYEYAKQLYARGAFDEALKRLNQNLRICWNHVLSWELKFRCLLQCLFSGDQSSRLLWNCGVQMKAHANEVNMTTQKLSVQEKRMVQQTIRKHLKLSAYF